MDANTRQLGVLFLDRDRFDLYVSGANTVSTFPFQDTIVNSMDVVNLPMLETQIKTFVDQSSIHPANLMILVSQNIIFEKDIEEAESEKRGIEIEKFRETVPFESLYILSFPVLQKIRILTVNKGLCDAIKNSFEKIGFIVSCVIPYVALGPDAENMTGLDPQVSQQIIKRWDGLKHYGFPIDKNTETSHPSPPKKPEAAAKKINTRAYIMIGVFIFLLLALLFLIFLR